MRSNFRETFPKISLVETRSAPYHYQNKLASKNHIMITILTDHDMIALVASGTFLVKKVKKAETSLISHLTKDDQSKGQYSG